MAGFNESDQQPDPIIKAILASRHVNDVPEQFEMERQRRMFNMLRFSKQYKKRQIMQANEIWDDFYCQNGIDGIDEVIKAIQGDKDDHADARLRSEITLLEKIMEVQANNSGKKSVSFAEDVTIIAGNGRTRVSSALSKKERILQFLVDLKSKIVPSF